MAIHWFELRDARTLAGLTQGDLARRMGVSIRSIQNYERPEAEIPRKAEHAIRRVLVNELAHLKAARERGDYEPATDADSDLSNVALLTPRDQVAPLNPRLAGISNTEMLRELLARDLVEALDGDRDLPSTEPQLHGVGGISDDDLAGLEQAAGDDDTAPRESDT